MTCTRACKRPTPSQAHCTTCHRTFGGVRGFEVHRKNGACIDPATRGWVEIAGVWRQPASEEVRERLARSREAS